MVVENPNTQQGALLLLQFAREPQAGRVKTRMMPYLSASQACDLHCELTLWTCRQLLTSGLGDVEIAVAGNVEHALFKQCEGLGVTRITPQRGADLGHRMYNALQAGLAGYGRVILVGSDCPQIDAAYLLLAAQALQRFSVVLGPAADGGYVLIGARAIHADVFRDIPWGSDQVYANTVSALDALQIPWTALPCLSDIDRPEDIPLWDALANSATTSQVP